MSNALRRSVRSAILVVLVLIAFSAPRAATPSSGTVSPSSPALTYTGGPFDLPNPTGDQGTPVVCFGDLKPCDDFALTVSIPPELYFLRVSLSLANAAADFDLYLYDAAGNVVKSSTGGAGAQESFQIEPPPGTNNFTVRVVPYDVATGSDGDTYSATVTLTATAPPPEPPAAMPGVPRYENYAGPPALGNDAGEPSLGLNWATGNAMFQAGLQTLRVGFDDCASPALATWENKSFATTSRASADPILFTDSRTNRTFVSQLTGACSASAFTDDDGENYTPSEGCGTPAGADHQTIGGGPFAPDPIGPTTSYQNAVYYCSQSSATSFCALSRNGGLSYGPGVAAWNLTQCGAIHGHIKVAPYGTAYVPNRSCTGTAGVIASENNGTSWTVRKVCVGTCNPNGNDGVDSTTPFQSYLVDPSIGIGSGGRVYFGYQRND